MANAAPVYLKCSCKECGNHIEFPASAARTTVACPHCGQWTELFAPETETKEAGLSIGLVPLIGGVTLLIALVAGGAWFYHQSHSDKTVAENPPVKVTVTPIVKSAPAPQPPAIPSASTDVVTQAVEPATPKAPARPKSPDDLKVGAIEMEKTKGSSLVYAVGTVENDSDYDRYGVRIELDLLNSKGLKIGTAKDYRDYLAPHQKWQFRALIPETRTVTARFSSLKEDQ